MFARLKFGITLIMLFVSQSLFAQSSYIDPYKVKPTYGPNCNAKTIDQAQGWITMTFMADVAYQARKYCGWNFDQELATKFELMTHGQVIACYGSANATKIAQQFQAATANTGSRCNDPQINAVKGEYAAKLAVLSRP